MKTELPATEREPDYATLRESIKAYLEGAIVETNKLIINAETEPPRPRTSISDTTREELVFAAAEITLAHFGMMLYAFNQEKISICAVELDPEKGIYLHFDRGIISKEKMGAGETYITLEQLTSFIKGNDLEHSLVE